jgi:hypothetical protein
VVTDKTRYFSNITLKYVAQPYTMSEIKEAEDAGESMKRGAKKAGNRIEEGAEEAKDKVD